MGIVLALVVGVANAWECPAPVDPGTLQATLDAADDASIALDDAKFRDLVNQAAGIELPCVSGALPPATVAHHHRVMALHLLTVGDDAGAKVALEAARAADPEYVFPDELLPPGHPLRDHYEQTEVRVTTRRVPEPRAGSVSFDGRNSRNRPKVHPTIAQFFDAQGQATSTTYVGPREPLPPYRAIPRQRNVLLLSSASALVISGTMYGLAWAQRGDLFDTALQADATAGTLNAKRDRTNALTVGSGAFLGIAVGTGVGAVLIGER